MPWKTILTVVTFAGLALAPRYAPAMKSYRLLDPQAISAVWTFPMPAQAAADSAAALEQARAARLQLLAPQNLSDPRHELDRFYAALLRGGVTRILHYGDSPTTGDLITADARALLQRQFGDAGAGFVLIAKPWAWYYHRGVEMDASHWQIDVAGATALKDGMHGLGGASFQGSAGAVARWNFKDRQSRIVDVAYLARPEGGAFSIEADGVPAGSADTSALETAPGFASFDLPDGARQFTLRVTRGAVRLYGVEFRKKSPGVIYSSLGINGANITVLSHAFNGAHWTAELRHYKPNLVVLAYGTNESGYAQFVETTWAKELKTAVRRLQTALPNASILLMSPMDRGEKTEAGEIDTVPALPRLVEIESQVAADMGVAFFNTYQAMGGRGTMARWYAAEPRLVGSDFIHPLPPGAKIVGELLYNALRDGYNEFKLRRLNQTAAADPAAAPRTGSELK
ncbi:MAG TPA: GDSL-type esterase/lipase family protein [Bryobacteraceae bacterium]|nr:GDSL-type esterase/lipase family protein [Bryobacteraceae bacterium]